MSDNTYWGTVPADPELIGPGDFEDNNGTLNDKPAIWMGEALVEGTLKGVGGVLQPCAFTGLS